MKVLLLLIGFSFIVGGAASLNRDGDTVLFSTGPELNSDYPKQTVDVISNERKTIFGYTSLVAGIFVCVLAFRMGSVKVPEVHDS